MSKMHFSLSKSTLIVIVFAAVLFISADRMNPSGAPAGYTGENAGTTCKNCHVAADLNPLGTSVVISGIPDNYVPGTTYTLSLTVNNPSISGTIWGFALKSSASGINAGSFSNLPAGTRLNSGGEMTHSSPFSASTISSLGNIKWTAPAAPTSSQNKITFYVATVSGNFSGAVITGSKTTTLQATSVSTKTAVVSSWTAYKSGAFLDVRMNLSRPSKMQIMLYTLEGKKVLQQSGLMMGAGDQFLQVPIKNLTPGTYLVVLQDEKGRQTQKVIF